MYGNITRTRNVSEYMLDLAVCLVGDSRAGVWRVAAGGGDVAEQRRDGGDGVGGQRAVVVDVVQRGRSTPVAG